jgi:copper chaperone
MCAYYFNLYYVYKREIPVKLTRSGMAIQLKIPNLKGDDCAKKITKSIQTMESDAKIDVNVDTKTVTVDTAASEESIKQIIQSAGFTIEGY